MTFKLTAKQHEALDLFSSDAMFYLLAGGSRSTKTFTILRTIIIRALAVPGSRHAVFRFRFNHVKASVVFDTFPKVMKLCFSQVTYKLNREDWFVEFPMGSQIWFGGLDDKERTEKVLGLEFSTIFLNECSQISYSAFLTAVTRLAQRVTYQAGGETRELRLKFFCDENPPGKGHWTHKLFVEGLDPDTRKPLANHGDYLMLVMNPRDNAENLPQSYLDALQRLPRRQRDRFWLGVFADENENAYWSIDIIEKNKVSGADLPEFVRLVVAVDPSGKDDDPEKNNDDIGIVVAGLGTDGRVYVLEDLTIGAGPLTWSKVVYSAYERHEADRVIGERNFGGAMVEHTIKTARYDDPDAPARAHMSYKDVVASRGKMLRAEPIAALHETGKIKFVGDFPELEDECYAATSAGYSGIKSPNRLDAFVFAATELFPQATKPAKVKKAPLAIPDLKRF